MIKKVVDFISGILIAVFIGYLVLIFLSIGCHLYNAEKSFDSELEYMHCLREKEDCNYSEIVKNDNELYCSKYMMPVNKLMQWLFAK